MSTIVIVAAMTVTTWYLSALQHCHWVLSGSYAS